MSSNRRAEGTLLGVAPPAPGSVTPGESVAPSPPSVPNAAVASVVPAGPIALSVAPEHVDDEELLYPSLAPGAGEARVPPPLPWRGEALNEGSASSDEQQTPRVAQALKQPAQLFGRAYPLWMLLAPASVVLFGAATLLGIALSGSGPAPAPAPPKAVPVPVAVAPVVAPPAPTLDLAVIQAKPPEARTVAETLALANQTAEKKREAAAKRAQEILQTPASLRKKATLAELRKLAFDASTAPSTLAAIANCPGPLSADLLYEFAGGASSKSNAAELSRALLSAQGVRDKASDALQIALKLSAAQTASDLAPLLERAREVGDKRALAPLKKWKKKRPCANAGPRDCVPKDLTKLIDKAIDGAKGRRPPLEIR